LHKLITSTLRITNRSICKEAVSSSATGQSRRFGRTRATSALPRWTDILRIGGHVSKVPTTEVQVGLLATCFLASG